MGICISGTSAEQAVDTFDERWLSADGVVLVGPEITWILLREIQRLRKLNAAPQVSPPNPPVGEGESTTADREPVGAAPSRPPWWNAKPLHPRYGPCDGFVDSTCSECRRIMWEQQRQLTEAWKRERCLSEELYDAHKTIDDWAQDR